MLQDMMSDANRTPAGAAGDAVRRTMHRLCPWLTEMGVFAQQAYGTGPQRSQGWKLHVSATPANAAAVLERCLPVLLERGAPFKVVRSTPDLVAMNGGHYGHTQIGKFITVYPSDDAQAVALAAALHTTTAGLGGPRVPTDRQLCPGSLVHYRYGVFTPVPGADTDNGTSASGHDMLDVAGRLTYDVRATYYVAPEPEIADPFEAAGLFQPPPPRKGALAGRFVVYEVLHRSWHGGVFAALDLGARPVTACVLKEIWHDVGSQEDGSDARVWAENEAALLQRHAGDPALPMHLASFELDSNLYVAVEYVPGESLDRALADADWLAAGMSVNEIVPIGRQTAALLAHLHERGIIFRDFKPDNVVRTPEGGYRLIDFGISYDTGDTGDGTRHAVGVGSPHYASPQQYGGGHPDPRDDVFSWGAALHQLACGERSMSEPADADIPAQSEAERGPAGMPIRWPFKRRPLRELRPDFPAALAETIDRAVAWEPERRFRDMSEALAAFSAAAETSADAAAASAAPTPAHAAIVRTERSGNIEDTENAVSRSADPLTLATEVGLLLCEQALSRAGATCWASLDEESGRETHSPDLYNGAAGIGLALAELARLTGEKRFAEVAKSAAAWVMGPVWGRGRALPGLHCGEAGVGYFLLQLAALLDEPGYVAAAELRARRLARLRIQSQELLYGAAGTLAFLAALAEVTDKDAYRVQALAIGDRLLSEAHRPADGSAGVYWEIASTMPDRAPHRYLGLAHGAAGIGLALAELARLGGGERFLEGAAGVAETLLAKCMQGADGGWRWGRDLNDDEPTIQAWCHGAGGIGRFFLRLWQVSHDARHAEGARMAARTVAQQTNARSGVCHGAAGDGLFLLECARAFADARYLEAAQRCADAVQTFREPDRPGAYVLNRQGAFSPDLMLGSAGIGLFYARLAAAQAPAGVAAAGFSALVV